MTKFWRIYKRFIIISLIIIVLILSVLWLFLDSYEKSQPFYKAEYVVNKLKTGKAKKIVEKLDVINKELNTNKKIAKILNNEYENQKITYEKKTGYFTKETPVYNIILNDKIIGTLYLEKNNQKNLFGLNNWSLQKIEGLLPTPKTINIIAKKEFLVYVENNELTNKDIINSNYETEEIKELKKHTNLDSIISYEVKGIYEEPSIYGQISGKKYTAIMDNEQNLYRIGFDEDRNLFAEQKEYLDTIIKDYTKYIINEHSFNNIKEYLINGSETYKILQGISRTNIWLKNHTPATFDTIDFLNMQVYSSDAYSIEAKYIYKYRANGENKEFETNLTLYMVKKDNKWLVAYLKTN